MGVCTLSATLLRASHGRSWQMPIAHSNIFIEE